MSETLKVIQFCDEAKKRGVSVEAVRCGFEKDIGEGKTIGVVPPTVAEVMCFDADEIEALCSELLSGKIALSNLAEQLNLTIYQIRLVLQHLLKTKQIKGELTYSTFISKATLKKTSLQKAAEHKRLHRLKKKTALNLK